MKTETLTQPVSVPSTSHPAMPSAEKEEEAFTAGKATLTFFLAIVFLAVVMGLSYLFISGTK